MPRLGSHGPTVSRLALGCMGMSGAYGPSERAESIATIQAALDSGINLIDTGDFYGMGHNEMLIGEALRHRRGDALLSVKFGSMRTPAGAWSGFDARPAAVKNFVAYSLTRLGVDHIDIYRPSRLDPTVPIEDTIGAIADLIQAGYVRYAGLSEVGPATLRRAQATHPISDLQSEYSLISRGPEAQIFPTCAELGIGATVYGVFSRGLLTGSTPASHGDFRLHLPRFSSDHQSQNSAVVRELNRLARAKGITPAQLALAWVLTKNSGIVPVIGARTRRQLADSIATLDLQLLPEDMAELEQAVHPEAIAGTRYDGRQMGVLDSEKR